MARTTRRKTTGTKARPTRNSALDRAAAESPDEQVVELVPRGGARPLGARPEASASHSETPDYLIPKMGQYPAKDSAFYRTVTLTDIDAPSTEGADVPLDGPLDPLAFDVSQPQATAPARGVILTHEQSWSDTCARRRGKGAVDASRSWSSGASAR